MCMRINVYFLLTFCKLWFLFLQIKPREQQLWATLQLHWGCPHPHHWLCWLSGEVVWEKGKYRDFAASPSRCDSSFRKPWAGDGACTVGIITLTVLIDFSLQNCQNYVSKQFVLLASKHPRATRSNTKFYMRLLYCMLKVYLFLLTIPFGLTNYIPSPCSCFLTELCLILL